MPFALTIVDLLIENCVCSNGYVWECVYVCLQMLKNVWQNPKKINKQTNKYTFCPIVRIPMRCGGATCVQNCCFCAHTCSQSVISKAMLSQCNRKIKYAVRLDICVVELFECACLFGCLSCMRCVIQLLCAAVCGVHTQNATERPTEWVFSLV